MSSVLARRAPSASRGTGGVSFEITGPAHAPVVAVLGGISATRHVTATTDDPSPGWWDGIVGRGKAVDTRRFRTISIDYLSERADGGFPRTDDQAAALARALDAAGVDQLCAVVGASYGGMVALAFGASYPERARQLVVIAAAHGSDARATALRVLQRKVVELGIETGRARDAVAIARGIAVTSYGTATDFRARFAGDDGSANRRCRRISEHLLEAGARFARTCSPERFIALSRSLDLHDVRPEDVRVPATVLAVTDDQLVPLSQARDLAARLGAPCRLIEIESVYGHDAFLEDPAAIAPLLSAALSRPTGIQS